MSSLVGVSSFIEAGMRAQVCSVHAPQVASHASLLESSLTNIAKTIRPSK